MGGSAPRLPGSAREPLLCLRLWQARGHSRPHQAASRKPGAVLGYIELAGHGVPVPLKQKASGRTGSTTQGRNLMRLSLIRQPCLFSTTVPLRLRSPTPRSSKACSHAGESSPSRWSIHISTARCAARSKGSCSSIVVAPLRLSAAYYHGGGGSELSGRFNGPAGGPHHDRLFYWVSGIRRAA